MSDVILEIHGTRVLQCDPDGPLLRGGREATDIVAALWEARAHWIAIPVTRLGKDFFDLKTRIAGDILQKFANYDGRVAIVGNISGYSEKSAALRDFVTERNRGNQVWFVATLNELATKIEALGP